MKYMVSRRSLREIGKKFANRPRPRINRMCLSEGNGNQTIYEIFKLQSAIEDQSLWGDLPISQIILIAVLTVEVLLGLFGNIAALVIYCQVPSTQWKAGDMFTVSLIVADLILSGITVPLIIIRVAISNTSQWINSLCMGTKAVLLFSSNANAAGSALLALDRRDISLRPSRKFFRNKRPHLAILITWCISTAGLIIPWVLSSIIREIENKTNPENIIYTHVKLTAIEPQMVNISFMMNNKQCDVTCYATRYKSKCSFTRKEMIIRLSVQLTVFLTAAIIIIVSYLKILRSVQQRNSRHAKKTVHSDSKNRRFSISGETRVCLGRILCCVEIENQAVLMAMKRQTKSARLNTSESSLQNLTHKSPNNRSTREDEADRANKKTCQITTHDKAKQNGKEMDAGNASIVPVAKSNAARAVAGKTDFATVAMSVRAVMTLKRMVRERKKLKQKKIRHLRRMTILISVTYLIFWTPFHILPFIYLFNGQALTVPTSYQLNRCNVTDTSANEFNNKIIITENKPFHDYKETLVLCSIILVAASSVVNPFLYSFTREKVRKDFKKIFCHYPFKNQPKADKTNGSPQVNIKNKTRTAIWTATAVRSKNNTTRPTRSGHQAVFVTDRRQEQMITESLGPENDKNSAIEFQHKLLPKICSPTINKLHDESVVDTSCTSVVTNHDSGVRESSSF